MAEPAVSAETRMGDGEAGGWAFLDIAYPMPGQCTRLSGLSNN